MKPKRQTARATISEKMRPIELRRQNKKAISLAGPRYTPGLDPNAPNLAIEPLHEVFDAIGITPSFRARIATLRSVLAEEWQKTHSTIKVHLTHLVNNPERIIASLHTLERASPPNVASAAGSLRRSSRRSTASMVRYLRKIDDARQRTERDSDERRSLDYSYELARHLMSALDAVQNFVDSPSFELTANNVLLVLGGWGTGKTHALCDVTRQRTSQGLPTLLLLASQIPAGTNPIDGICQTVPGARDRQNLLTSLQHMGAQNRTRALLIIDAINEGDREAWRTTLRAICREMRQYPNVGLVLSCRQPYDRLIVTQGALKRLVTVSHDGFRDIEFDAQLSFFDYYGIPAPDFPLISEEFSRPLFLKILCNAIGKLTLRNKKEKLRHFASGQRGMTYVLEYFIKEVAKDIEKDFGLSRGTCWKILKGDRSSPGGVFVGIAPSMARNLRDYLTNNETTAAIEAFVQGPDNTKKSRYMLRRMITDGLLGEDVHWNGETTTEIVRFPYQRFADHLIARHLLREHLKTSSVLSIKRCFYRNRPLGEIFDIGPNANSFAMPGLASAIMLEFPERVKKVARKNPRELIFYLPRMRRRARTFKEPFLEGLSWRSAESFTDETNRLVGFLLTQYGDTARDDTLEVLVGLASRPGHPYSADSLRQYLMKMPMADRDLSWTEYVRHAGETSSIFRLLEWIERREERGISVDAAKTMITLTSLVLTTTRRTLRDRATRALFLLGRRFSKALFSASIESLSFNDPYVPERMLAASYGVAMSLWADPAGQSMRDALAPFARRLLEQMFLPNAPYSTHHVLMRDYALGTITLARHVSPDAIPRSKVCFLRKPVSATPSPLPPANALTDTQRAETEPALHMDFNNYTLGRLVEGRANYDFANVEYQKVRNQLLGRMSALGFANSRFEKIDRVIAESSWPSSDGAKTERYGKKYSWIAYFEIYSSRQEAREVRERDINERIADCDIDPSFPEDVKLWRPPLPRLFPSAPKDPVAWLQWRRRPRYEHLIERTSIDGIRGPWILLDGHIEQVASGDHRRVFTSLRGLLTSRKDVLTLCREVERWPYLGNSAVPETDEEYFTFAGEIPWSDRFALSFRAGRGRLRQNIKKAFSRRDKRFRERGIPVEVPAHGYAWERYHSVMNQRSGAEFFPAPALCSALGLVNRGRGFELYDQKGRIASLCRRFEAEGIDSRLLYIRKSQLKKYLRMTKQVSVWIFWGERDFKADSDVRMRGDLVPIRQAHQHIHKKLFRRSL